MLLPTKGKGGEILKRLLTYADKVYNLRAQLAELRDGRTRPRIKTPVVAGGALVMTLTQMGALMLWSRRREIVFGRGGSIRLAYPAPM